LDLEPENRHFRPVALAGWRPQPGARPTWAAPGLPRHGSGSGKNYTRPPPWKG
jgi:hypothetical protein